MAKKEYYGRIKYLGANSNSQEFKNATVTLHEENNKCFLKTCLKCNPRQLYKSNEIDSAANIFKKGTRLVIRSYAMTREFWELHFIGEPAQLTEKLFQDIMTMKKVTSKSPQPSRAEVSLGRKVTISKSDTGQSSPAANQLSTQNSSQHLLRVVGNSLPQMQTHNSPVSAPRFTGVRVNRRLSSDTEMVSDIECKENQYSGPVSSDVDKQNKLGARKPLQSSSFRFYGSSVPDTSFTTAGFELNQTPSNSLQGAKRERLSQFSDITKTYTWNHSRASPVVPDQTPQLQGFANIGNTCYMNAILQALFSLDTFAADLRLLHKQHSKSLTRESLAFALTKLMVSRQRPQFTNGFRVRDMLRNVKEAISSTAKRFSGSQQHDAHEFLGQILDQLKEEVNKVIKNKQDKAPETTNKSCTDNLYSASGDTASSVLDLKARLYDDKSGIRTSSVDGSSPFCDRGVFIPDNIGSPCNRSALKEPSSKSPTSISPALVNPTYDNFEFEVVHSFECVRCHERVEKAEEFNDLSVDMPSSSQPGMKLSLQDALDIFFQKEEIEYKCEKCGPSKAELTHKFAKLPRVLILHLKRYSYNMESRKMMEKLQLPRFITLQDHCDQSTVPHLPHRLLLSSPMKSPMTPSPVNIICDLNQRRRRMKSGCSENGENEEPKKSPKRVRRSLLPEVGGDDDAFVLNKDDKNEKDLEKGIEQNKESCKLMADSISTELDDSYEEQLEKALVLSRREYEASNMQDYSRSEASQENINNNSLSTLSHNLDVNGEGCAEADVFKLSEYEQIQLAISLSLAPLNASSPHNNSAAEEVSHLTSDSTLQEARSSLFKKPLSTPSTEVKFKCGSQVDDCKILCGRGKNVSSLTDTEDTPDKSELSSVIVKGRSSSANDLFHDAQLTSQSLDSSDTIERNSLHSLDSAMKYGQQSLQTPPRMQTGGADHSQTGRHGKWSPFHSQTQFTRCRHPFPKHTKVSRQLSQPVKQVTSKAVSRHMGSVGCMSGSAIGKKGNELCDSVDMDDLSSLVFSDEEDGDKEHLAHVSPSSLFSSYSKPTNWVNSMDSSPSDPKIDRLTVVNGIPAAEVLSPTEKMFVEDLQEELPDSPAMQLDLSVNASSASPEKNSISHLTTPKKKDGQQNAEEKENLSPFSSHGCQQTPAVMDKELEARLLEHKLRLTEIEKGLFPHSYRLVSIVNHLGETSGFGHYVSDVLDVKKQTWFSYDDKEVSKTTESHVRTKRTSTGYIFFYLSKDTFDDIDSMRPGGIGKELSERIFDRT